MLLRFRRSARTEQAPEAPAIVFFGGKGGVGKTTMAAAHALRCADQGLRTLLVSTDPAHSLGDALAVPLGDEPVRVVDNLWAREPDADAALRRRVRRIGDDAARALPREILPAVSRHLEHAAAGPGMAESALADLLMATMEEVPERWDRLVVDSAPTGHLLRLLHLPELLTPWVQGLARQRERAVDADRFAVGVVGGTQENTDDPLLEKLHARRRRLERAATRLREDAEVRLVLVPRRMVLAETDRAAKELADTGFRLGTVVVNQVPAEVDPEILRAVHTRFAEQGTVESPLTGREPLGADALRALVLHPAG
ncbi:ArsA family ATPase [Nocardiopsis sp. MG754419]|uniref:ArsA family ATPase n=1 Tax=Nocardiopsis sp. MG754419 TaxID=2259865 RepID=UPI0027DCAF0E|nr:ArsA family ATPase [Nocardiopsis sp. MG754419]MBR8743319.1 ArsA family ATPase [Nocardiopsis sp. MG754419]